MSTSFFSLKCLRRIVAAILSWALVFSSIGATQAWATGLSSMNGMINGMFSAMGSPSAVSTANSEVYSLGYVATRNQIVNPNLIAFAPPHFSAGCGGINMYFGSWSFINGAQLQQLLTAIGQAAATFLFQMAVQAMCQQCSAVLDDLQKASQDMNKLLHNSCQLAAGLFTSPKNFGTQTWKDITNADTDLGKAADDFASDFGPSSILNNPGQAWKTLSTNVASQWGYSAFSTSSTPPTGSSASSCADFSTLANSIKFGNMTWKALVNNDASAALGAPNDGVTTELMMSLLGTTVVLPTGATTPPSSGTTAANGANTGNTTGTRVSQTQVATLTLKDLVDGVQSAPVIACLTQNDVNGQTYDAFAGTCAATTTSGTTTSSTLSPMGCLKITNDSSQTLGTLNYGGIKNMVHCLLFGQDVSGNPVTCKNDWPDPNTGNAPLGLVADMSSATGMPTAQEKQIADMSPIPVYALMSDVSHKGAIIRYIAQEAEPYIVASIASAFGRAAIEATLTGMSNNNGSWTQPPDMDGTLNRLQKEEEFYEKQADGAVFEANVLHKYVVTYLRSLNQHVRGLGTTMGH